MHCSQGSYFKNMGYHLDLSHSVVLLQGSLTLYGALANIQAIYHNSCQKNAEQSMGSTFTYNISHDNLMVAMVAQFGGTDKIGIDIMRRSIPKDETVVSFLRVIEDNVSVF